MKVSTGERAAFVREVEISRDEHALGAMKATLLDSVTALELTGFRESVDETTFRRRPWLGRRVLRTLNR
jgi:hypothetical protein